MKNVLIVDDETTFQLTLCDGLKVYDKDFRVLTAENGKKAKEVLDTLPVNLVVTDLKMAEMDGLELLAYMRKNNPYIPVIVMTAFGNPEMERWLRSLGVFAYLEKPFEFLDLKNMIFCGLVEKQNI